MWYKAKRKLHTALIDCELLSRVYVNLIDQKEPKLDFSEKKYEAVNSENAIINFSKKVIGPTTEELKEHQNFLKKSLKKTLFFVNFSNFWPLDAGILYFWLENRIPHAKL